MEIVYLLDDSQDFTQAVKETLDRKRVFDEVRAFNDVDDFLQHMNPDVYVAIVDFYMPKLNGLEVTRKIKQIQPDCLVIIVSINEQQQLPISFLSERFMGYVSKSDDYYITKIVDLAKNHFELMRAMLKMKKKYEI
jgi:DNA-binding NarL/FixJ family response regulator